MNTLSDIHCGPGEHPVLTQIHSGPSFLEAWNGKETPMLDGNTAELNAHERAQDARSAFARRTEASMRREMSRALAGLLFKVPVIRGYPIEREVEESIGDMVYELSGYAEVSATLLKVLRESECPHVSVLRKLLIERYVQKYAEDIVRYRDGGGV